MHEKKVRTSEKSNAQKKPQKLPSSTKPPTPDEEKKIAATPKKAMETKNHETAKKLKGENGDNYKSDDKKELAATQKEEDSGVDLEKDIFEEVSSKFDQFFSETKEGQSPEKTSDELFKKGDSKPSPAVKYIEKDKEQTGAERQKVEKKKYAAKSSAEKSEDDKIPKETTRKPTFVPRIKKNKKITSHTDVRAAKTVKPDILALPADSDRNPEAVKATKKKDLKPPTADKDAKTAKVSAEADEKKEDRTVNAKTSIEKIDSKEIKRKSSYKTYALIGTLVILILVIALFVFRTAGMTKKSKISQKISTQKISKVSSKLREKKVVPIQKKSLEQKAGSVKVNAKVVPQKELPVKTSAADEINNFVMKWKTAWENSAGTNGDIETYMSFFSDDFSAGGLDKNGWKKDKRAKNTRKDWIRVGVKNINISGPLKDNRFEVSIIQDYQSSNYSGISKKNIVLKREESGWKIIGIKTAQDSSAYAARHPYSIYTGSCRSRQTAEQFLQSYRKMGLQTFWVRVDLGKKGVWYRVFIGCYEDTQTAEKIIKTNQLTDASAGETKYANLIGTYVSEDTLKNKIRFLSERGCSPYYIKSGNDQIRLYVGAFYTRKNAEKLSSELNSKGIRSRIVER